MTEEKQYLKVLLEHKHIYDNFKKTGEIINLTPTTMDAIASAYRTEHPYFQYNHRCHACVVDMICQVYEWYNKIQQQ